MVNEEYFKKLEAKHVGLDAIQLAMQISKYTDDEKKVTRIINALRRAGITCIDSLMVADIDELATIRTIGHDALNILRQIKGLPTITYADEHPKTYRVYFYSPEDSNFSWFKDFNTLRELHEFFNRNECKGVVIKHIVKKEDKP